MSGADHISIGLHVNNGTEKSRGFRFLFCLVVVLVFNRTGRSQDLLGLVEKVGSPDSYREQLAIPIFQMVLPA
jgi:hypothetical protein